MQVIVFYLPSIGSRSEIRLGHAPAVANERPQGRSLRSGAQLVIVSQ